MHDRIFRAIYGSTILAALYWDLNMVMQLLIAVLLLEGISNWRLSLLLQKLLPQSVTDGAVMSIFPSKQLFHIPCIAERAWRVLVAVILYLSVFLYPEPLWALPWFMGFAILGAGISGVCPMLFSLHFVGFK